MKTILVPLDFSAATERVIGEAERLAKSLGARIVVLHVEPPEPDYVGYEPGPQAVRDTLAEEVKEYHEKLHAVRDELRRHGVQADAFMIQGPTVEKIIEESKRLKAEYVVMGSHGHGALYDLVVGSVSEGVMRHSPRPVVIVPVGKTPAAEEA